MLRWAVEECTGPAAVRYPRGGEGSYAASDWQGITGPLVKCHRRGGDITLITYGRFLDNCLEAAQLLSQAGIEAGVVRLLTVSDLPVDQILENSSESRHFFVVEETMGGCGIREELYWELTRRCPDCRVEGLDLGKDFVPHGSVGELYRHCGVDAASIAEKVKEGLGR